MTKTSNQGAWLTQEAYDRLKKELDYISGPYRHEIVERIDQARSEGDLKENGGYHAAREEQGKNEGRIAHLKGLLENAQVGEAPADDGIVEAGMVVTAEIAGEPMTFLIGSREVAEDLAAGSDLEVFSEKSPMGSAISGHQVGDELSYTAPNGKQIPVKILDAKPFQG
ncbi:MULTISPECIES: transcription elongation factor GreA [Kocuria]|uniref:Transcription elongation factor GreA n=1 Tax=Kocuria oceani TaxID=988827 RepID=A0ABV9TDZ5_9MICC|nr:MULTISPECIES: transcription elongation factor GreA [Kocuria]KLU09166.1 transcription elongation factor GreA [Kocuria sp. SM24M-10]OLT05444.1 transcription elongation factor GreA [Kocuria sp. CNJ-770]